jgi:hypothetical protein
MSNANNSPVANSKNNDALLTSLSIGGALIIGIATGLWLRKNKVKKH